MKDKLRLVLFCLGFSVVSIYASTVHPLNKNGMSIKYGAQLVADRQILLWTSLNADEGNAQGFVPKDFIPFCELSYRISKDKSTWIYVDNEKSILTRQGPEYGSRIKIDGPGHYSVTETVYPPDYHGFFRHTDKATGVAPWWKPFTLHYQFTVTAPGAVKG